MALNYGSKTELSLPEFYFGSIRNKIDNTGHFAFFDNKLKGFVIGDIINIDNIIEYEILLIYIDNEKRNLGYASKLLSTIYSGLNHRNLKKIYLEVASNNYKAIKLYTKNGYKKTGTRKKYYNFTNKKIDAILYEKTINDTIKS